MIKNPRAEGLRERKKREMRANISAVALRQAIEHGVAHVTTEMIAAELGVSQRTIGNYFSSKEEAIVGTSVIRADRFCSTLRERSSGEPLHEALLAAALDVFASVPDRDGLERIRLIRSTPALFAEERKSDVEIERMIAAEIGYRTGTDPTFDISPRIRASLILATMHTAVNFWLDSPAEGALGDVMRDAMAQFRLK